MITVVGVTSAYFARGMALIVLLQRRSNALCGEGTMLKHRYSLPLLAAITIGAGLAGTQTAHAQQTLTQRVKEEKCMNLPARGRSMAQVEKKYGEPVRKL